MPLPGQYGKFVWAKNAKLILLLIYFSRTKARFFTFVTRFDYLGTALFMFV